MRSTRWVVMLSAALLIPGSTFGEDAKKRGSSSSGGSSGGSSSSSKSSGASSRQPSSSSGSSSSRSSGSSGNSSRASSDDNRGSRSSGSSGSTVSGPESRHPRPGTGTGYKYPGYDRYGYGYGYGGYYGYSPYYYRPYYYGYYGVPYYGVGFSTGYGWDDGYVSAGYSAPYYRSSYGGYYRYRETGSIRTIVDPEKTRIYVDGYYAGTVDDFDGMFQRLYVAPGRHDVTLKLDGYRTHKFKVYVTEDSTVKIRHSMERGTGDDVVTDLTEGREEPPYRLSQDDEGRDRYSRPTEDRGERELEAQTVPRPEEGRQLPDLRDAGTLRVEVRPDDASIYVDGQFFGTGRRAGSIALPPGRHRVEAVRPGFRTVERDVEVRVGKTESLAIDLVRN
jgi:hypothetical protein